MGFIKFTRAAATGLCLKWACMFGLLVPAPVHGADAVTVAVASNFLAPMQQLARDFSAQTGVEVNISSGSTGKLYAQIVNGAPFDLFLAADSREPQKLDEAGRIEPGTRFTYALGTLVAWSHDPGLFHDDNGRAVLMAGGFRHVAIANPKLAPYGAAAMSALEKLGIAERLKPELLTGENIAQAYQYVETGNAEVGFVALSQLAPPGTTVTGSYWRVDPALYPPIRQQAVLLAHAPSGAAARRLWEFLRTEPARETIAACGYTIERAVTEAVP
jgi:molybdate transport system substrate-binding protein